MHCDLLIIAYLWRKIKRVAYVTSKKKTFYRIEDFFLLFWFRFVYKYLSVITSGRGRELYDKIIVLHTPHKKQEGF